MGGVHGCGGMCGCRGDVSGIRRDTVNEWAARILLECILVLNFLIISCYRSNPLL